ncbi:28068_t:CDS:1, partial [Gigaspora margarita]
QISKDPSNVYPAVFVFNNILYVSKQNRLNIEIRILNIKHLVVL